MNKVCVEFHGNLADGLVNDDITDGRTEVKGLVTWHRSYFAQRTNGDYFPNRID